MKVFKFTFTRKEMDYGYPEKRKNRNDKRAKGRFNKYKKGGKHRSENIAITGKKVN